MTTGQKGFYAILLIVVLLRVMFLAGYGLAALTGWSLWVTIPTVFVINGTSNLAVRALA